MATKYPPITQSSQYKILPCFRSYNILQELAHSTPSFSILPQTKHTKQMSRAFSTTRQHFAKWLGYRKELLTPEFKWAAEHYSENGAVKKVGEIESIEILHRNDGTSPIHQSRYNPKDKELIISARITPADGSKARTHHIYANGTGTMRVGDKREYSTSTRE